MEEIRQEALEGLNQTCLAESAENIVAGGASPMLRAARARTEEAGVEQERGGKESELCHGMVLFSSYHSVLSPERGGEGGLRSDGRLP